MKVYVIVMEYTGKVIVKRGCALVFPSILDAKSDTCIGEKVVIGELKVGDEVVWKGGEHERK